MLAAYRRIYLRCIAAIQKIERHTYPGYDDVDTEDKWVDALDAVLWSLGTIQDKNKMAKFVKLDGEERAAYDAKIRKRLAPFWQTLRAFMGLIGGAT